MPGESKFQLLIDTSRHVLVASRRGKPSDHKPDENVRLKGQRGVECGIASRKRIRPIVGKMGFLHSNAETMRIREAELVLKKVKKILRVWPLNLKKLRDHSIAGIKRLGFDAQDAVYQQDYFLSARRRTPWCQIGNDDFYQTMPLYYQAWACYYTLLEKADLEFGLSSTKWRPSQGVDALQETLRSQGQIIFQGYFGQCFHGKPNTVHYPDQSTDDRQVFYFKKNSIQIGDWTHCVIVDEIKWIGQRAFVYFRDPYDDSTPDQADKVYGLSYDKFVARLRNNCGMNDDENVSYGTALSPEPRL